MTKRYLVSHVVSRREYAVLENIYKSFSIEARDQQECIVSFLNTMREQEDDCFAILGIYEIPLGYDTKNE